MQDCGISSMFTVEILKFCTKSSIRITRVLWVHPISYPDLFVRNYNIIKRVFVELSEMWKSLYAFQFDFDKPANKANISR